MEYAIVILAALIVSAVTLFSGFGLGTVLMPAFSLIFPLSSAIAGTAVVHLANNLFKLALVGRKANSRTVLLFGVPAAISAIAGASVLALFDSFPPLGGYEMLGEWREVTPVKLVIGLLIVGFAMLEFSPAFARLAISPKYLLVGGLLSGFFGGLSGNQGALRSAFLIKAGLSKEAFIATGVVSAVLVDVVRLAVYGFAFSDRKFESLPMDSWGIIAAAAVAAFLGSYVGSRLMRKVTFRAVQIVVALSMAIIGAGLAAGII